MKQIQKLIAVALVAQLGLVPGASAKFLKGVKTVPVLVAPSGFSTSLPSLAAPSLGENLTVPTLVLPDQAQVFEIHETVAPSIVPAKAVAKKNPVRKTLAKGVERITKQKSSKGKRAELARMFTGGMSKGAASPVMMNAADAAIRMPSGLKARSRVVGKTFIAFDLETSGFFVEANPPLEIAGKKFRIKEDGSVEVIGTFQSFIKADDVHPIITELTGITPEMVADAPELAEVFADFWKFAEGADAMVAHAAEFETQYMSYYADKLGLPQLAAPIVDNKALAKQFAQRADLGDLAETYGMKTQDHRAMADSDLTVKTFARHAKDLAARDGVALSGLTWDRLTKNAKTYDAAEFHKDFFGTTEAREGRQALPPVEKSELQMLVHRAQAALFDSRRPANLRAIAREIEVDYDQLVEAVQGIPPIFRDARAAVDSKTASLGTNSFLEFMHYGFVEQSEGGMQRARDFIDKHENILVVSHGKPDGDAVGSALGMTRVLRKLGKKAKAFLQDAVPSGYTWLPGVDEIISDPAAINDDYDAIMIVDAGELWRVGKAAEEAIAALGKPVFYLDHHYAKDPAVVEENWVDTQAKSATEMITLFAMRFGIILDQATATALYAGIFSDSGGFTYPPIRSLTWAATQFLTQAGVDVAALAQKVLWQRSGAQRQIRKTYVATEELHFDDRVSFVMLTQADFDAAGATMTDAQDLVNLSLEEASTRVVVMVRERPDGQWHVSLRSKAVNTVNVIPAAKELNPKGGGHKTAAGAIVESGTPAEIKARVLKEVSKLLD